MKWYHDLGNDRWIYELTGRKTAGYFFEAGALDGVAASATYALERYFGWRGICVEPNRDLYRQLVANRTCACESRCLADADGFVDYVEVQGEGVGYSGIRDHLADFKREFWERGKLTRRQAASLAQVLKTHNAPREIDYLALDTEGSELRILRAFDLSEYQVRAISVEGDACTELLTSSGYAEVRNPYSPVDYEHYFVRM